MKFLPLDCGYAGRCWCVSRGYDGLGVRSFARKAEGVLIQARQWQAPSLSRRARMFLCLPINPQSLAMYTKSNCPFLLVTV